MIKTPDIMTIYNGLDCCNTLEVYLNFWKELAEDSKYLDTYNFTMDLIEPLMFIMSRGILVDHTSMQEMRTSIVQEIEQKQKELNELAGRELNPLSPKDCQTYFYIEKDIKPYVKRTASGESRITCDDLALARIARGTEKRAGLREASLIQSIRGLQKLKGTYIDIKFDSDGRFRTSCKPRGTRFGRISSTKTLEGTGMNMQNLPPRFKQFLIPDPGYMFMEFDKRQAEWVVVAYQTGDANMISAVETGSDVHAYTGSLIYKVPYQLVEKENNFVGHETNPDEILLLRRKIPELFHYSNLPRQWSIRQAGKRANHSLNYDESYIGFSLMNEIPEAESKKIIQAYHDIYPNIRSNYRAIQQKLRKDRTLVNCFGRKYKFLDKWGPTLFRAAYSFIPQSTVPDLLNRGMIEIYHETEFEPVRSIELLAQVHDSILYQVPTKLGAQQIASVATFIANKLNPTMEYSGRKFQIATDLKIGWDWKNMDAVNLDDPSILEIQIAHIINQKGVQT